MMKTFLKFSWAAAAAAFALALSGCKVDQAYTLDNLKNIDLDVTLFQNGMQLRIADSTSVFRVDSLMKSVGLDTSEFIKQAPDGSYYIQYSDKMDLSEDISDIGLADVVTINALNIEQGVSYNLEGFDLENLLATIPPALLGEYTIPDIHYDISEKVEFDFMSAQDFPEMLVGVGNIVLKNVSATVDLVFTDLPGNDNQEYNLDATATLPSFCDPKVIELKGAIKKNTHFTRNILINKLDLSDKDFVAMRESGTSLSDSVVISGSVAATDVTVDLNNTATSVNGTATVSISDPQGKVDIQSLQVKIDYQTQQTFTSPFFALPEAFSDATLDLPNATIDLSVRTNMAFPITGTADLLPQGATQPTTSINFEVPYSLNPAEYKETNAHNEVNLNALLEAKADSIEFVTNIVTDKTTYCYIEPDADYGFELGFELGLPLALGAGTLINFADTLEIGADTGKTIGGILQESSIGIRANVKNTIPVSADITIGFLAFNEETGQYTNIPLNKPVTVQLPAPGESGLLEVVLGAEKGNTALESLTHMTFNIAVHANGQALKADNYVVLTDIYFMLPNGVHIPGNALKDSAKESENENE
ncbi:MAG: hypothetical protein IKO04_04105 [Bacteroidales bacterium]|nr:hypothetical protein [Bacteroidales bacterium]